MNDDGPKRTQTAPTLVIPRPGLAIREPAATRAVDRDAITLVSCPACEGEGMVTIEKRAELAAKLAPELDAPDDDEPKP